MLANCAHKLRHTSGHRLFSCASALQSKRVLTEPRHQLEHSSTSPTVFGEWLQRLLLQRRGGRKRDQHRGANTQTHHVCSPACPPTTTRTLKIAPAKELRATWENDCQSTCHSQPAQTQIHALQQQLTEKAANVDATNANNTQASTHMQQFSCH